MHVALQARTANLGIPAIAAVLLAWWGSYVIPSLAHLAWPGIVPPIPPWLNADLEGSLPNALSAAVLACTALALGLRAMRAARGTPWTALGWAMLAASAAGVGLLELTDWHSLWLRSWSIQPAPLAAAWMVGMGIFLWRGAHPPPARLLLGLGCGLWGLVPVHEAIQAYAVSRFGSLPVVTEETLEVTGTLGLLAATLHANRCPSASMPWRASVGGAILVVTACWVLSAACLYVVPLASTRDVPLLPTRGGPTAGGFQVELWGHGSIRQDLPPILFPSNRVDVRLALRGATPTTVRVRVLDGATVISTGEARVVPSAKGIGMQPFDLAPVLDTTSDNLSLQVNADLPPGAQLRVGARLVDPDGLRLQTNQDVHAGQRIETTVFSTQEPTRAKLAALGHAARDGWYVAVALFCWLSLIPCVAVPVRLATAGQITGRPRP
ncbi:MAG: hypothetical protein F4Y02_18055 [Chloroflexi bacterium]|nr:hypothetical protein [Chloroflexota bacterium]